MNNDDQSKKNKNGKRGITLAFIIGSIMLVGFLGSYAFYVNVVENNKNEEVTVKGAELALTFSDNDNGINAELEFGKSVTKKFTLENTGTVTGSVSLEWDNLINTYLNGSLTYRLEYSDSEEGEYTVLNENSNVPVTETPITQGLSNEISVPAGETYYFNLVITLNYTDFDQTSDLKATFQTNFILGEVSKYRYYGLTVDPNGGTWEDFTSAQEYQLNKDETKEISNPTREGYTFGGWEVNGIASSMNENTFTMGIGNTILRAKWNANKYPVTININGEETTQEVEYGSTITLNTPSREGYTFAGWEVTGGTIEGNKFTVRETENISITAKWTVNKYKYIVYHSKMNIDGKGYTLVDADTDEGEAEYNTTVTPTVKSYIGFGVPSTNSLTIQAEESYPPVLNKVEYNYERNKYTLTLDTQGGTYAGNLSEEMYYEAENILSTPEKTGYNFTNWTVGGEVVEDNKITMGTEEITVVANYTAKTYTVTFNANGGTVSSESKIVSYDGTYGDMPVPTYTGYKFMGWYTTATGGVQVTASSKVELSENQTLYAKWSKVSDSASTLAKLNKSVKSENPSFADPATTDETADGLYSMADDYGTSYYYRGAVEDNYVKFAGFYWRIIRINGDGSLRIIYDGTSAHANGSNSTNRLAITSQVYNANYDDAKYVGYMYGPSGTGASTSKSQAQTNTANSEIKTAIENWYKTNIADKGYDAYVSDTIYCNDRSTPGKNATGWSNDTGLGYGTNATAYGAYARSGSQPVNYNKVQPRFTC